MYLTQIKNNLKLQIDNLPNLIMNVIITNSGNLIHQVRSRWFIGESVHGGIIGEYRSEEYKAYKLYLNPQAKGNVDLMDTGSLVEKLLVRPVSKTSFEIISTDSKFQKLSKKYGIEEFGLNNKEWAEFEMELIVVILQTVLNQTYK